MEEGRQNRMDPQLFRAASNGDIQFFENLIDPNSSLLQVTIEKNTVLHVALQFKKFETAQKIVNLSPSLVYKTNFKGNTPLHVAAMVGDSSLLNILIRKAKDEQHVEADCRQLLRTMNLDGDIALHVAVRYHNIEVVEVLINEDLELAEYVNKAGESALFLAVDRQYYYMASLILSAAPDCSYAGRQGMNVLHAVVLQTTSNCKWLDLTCSLNVSALSILDYVY